MIQAAGRHITLPLGRPQYVAAPEAFACGLAWRSFGATFEPAPAGDRALALLYEQSPGATSRLEYRRSRPEGDVARAFAADLARHGLRAEDGQQEQLAGAILDGLRGVMAENSPKQASAPLSPATALLNNLSGFAGQADPPDIGKILDQMFSLGLESRGDDRTASSLWAQAVTSIVAGDPLVATVDRSLVATAMSSPVTAAKPKSRAAAEDELDWRGLLADSPFSWFAGAWIRLTSPEWVAAMPARVWADWAATVLRMAFGMGYLWEAAWFEAVARAVQQGTSPTWDELRASMDTLLPWPAASASMSIRDVSSRLSWRARRSVKLRELLSVWIDSHGAADSPICDVVSAMGGDADFARDLRTALSSKPRTSAANNRWEAIRFALKIRENSGPYADHYGLLRNEGRRWAVIDPGTEWVAVIASLAVGSPGHECDLGEVMLHLDALGLRPDLGDIVALLERSGLARGSADADLGVRVGSAY
jgi:hypothetical protein